MILVMLLLSLFSLPHLCDPLPPGEVEIVLIHDYDEDRKTLNYDSRVLLRYVGAEPLQHRPLSARFYVDDRPLRNTISTFHGEDFIPTHHFGVERMGGVGCQKDLWEPEGFVLIDFKDGTFHPGQVVRVDVLDTRTDCVISRDYYRSVALVQ